MRFQTPAPRSEINVTPLVDVCLVLLIVFMIVTPLLDGPRIELPPTEHPAKLDSGALVLTLATADTMLLGARTIAPDTLAEELRRAHATNPRLAVRADRRLPYRIVREALATAQAAGFKGAELVTLPRPGA